MQIVKQVNSLYLLNCILIMCFTYNQVMVGLTQIEVKFDIKQI